MALGVCAVEFMDGGFGVGESFVSYECGAFGAPGSVIEKGDGIDWPNAGEKLLCCVVLGIFALYMGREQRESNLEIFLGQVIVDIADSNFCSARIPVERC